MMFSVDLLRNIRKCLFRNLMKFRSFDWSVFHFNVIIISCNMICGYRMDKELGSDFFLITRNWSSAQDSLIVHGLLFCILIHFHPATFPAAHTVTSSQNTHFSKAALPNSSQNLKMVKGNCKKEQHFNIKWLSKHLTMLCYFYFFSLWAEKNEGHTRNVLFLLKIWVFKLGVFNRVFSTVQLQRQVP